MNNWKVIYRGKILADNLTQQRALGFRDGYLEACLSFMPEWLTEDTREDIIVTFLDELEAWHKWVVKRMIELKSAAEAKGMADASISIQQQNTKDFYINLEKLCREL